MRPSRAVLAALWIACAGAASAQSVHPMPVGPLPFHLRLAQADAVAIATVTAIHDGRIEVGDAQVLTGALGPSFEIKRAPSKPPPLAVGMPAVFLLRGARPPYVLADDPKDVIVLRDAASARAWREELPKLVAARGDPQQLLALYLSWLDGSDEAMRATAATALVDLRSKLPPLGDAAAVERARVALDGQRPIEVRRVSARLASMQPAGASALLRGLPGDAPDPLILDVALHGGALFSSPELGAALDRALASEDLELRRRAVRVAGQIWSDDVAAKVRTVSERDADPLLRQEAREALQEHATR
ncbi:MAG TPA: HEAT repeat domain-containing protein [Myxococcota bacterium]|nr:HEAT repeat domain-containing protein [Myxococcota bacterium]